MIAKTKATMQNAKRIVARGIVNIKIINRNIQDTQQF